MSNPVYRAVLEHLHQHSAGAACELVSHPELVQALFRTATTLEDASLMVLCKICSWDIVRDKISLVLSGEERRMRRRKRRCWCWFMRMA